MRITELSAKIGEVTELLFIVGKHLWFRKLHQVRCAVARGQVSGKTQSKNRTVWIIFQLDCFSLDNVINQSYSLDSREGLHVYLSGLIQNNWQHILVLASFEPGSRLY